MMHIPEAIITMAAFFETLHVTLRLAMIETCHGLLSLTPCQFVSSTVLILSYVHCVLLPC